MLSVRLPKDLEYDLEKLAKSQHRSKSDIVKEAVAQYIASSDVVKSSYDIGKQYFGKHGSDDSNRSSTYKSRLKEKLNEKHNR